jgi:hypothetical protein
MFNFCFLHKFIIEDIITFNQKRHKSTLDITVQGSEYTRILYRVKYKCKYCSKTKYQTYYYDETPENKITEFKFWLKDNKKDEK